MLTTVAEIASNKIVNIGIIFALLVVIIYTASFSIENNYDGIFADGLCKLLI